VWLHEYLEDFPNQQDALRYALCANAPETKDNDFTWKDFQSRNNNELVAILGNFVNRVLVLMQKYYQGKIPAPDTLQAQDQEVLQNLTQAPNLIGEALGKYRFREAQTALMQLARAGNKYLAEEEPWKSVKTNPERTQTVMYVAAQVAAQLSQLMEPFLPHSAAKLRTYLNLPLLNWGQLEQQELLIPGHTVEKGALLFQKIEDAAIEAQREKLEASRKANAAAQYAPSKEPASFDDFTKMDLRVGEITQAQKVPKTSKLLKLEVNLGFEKRTIVSGISQFFNPDEIIGQKVVVLANLKPRKIKGIASEGMILMADDRSGNLHFATVAKEAEVGSTIS